MNNIPFYFSLLFRIIILALNESIGNRLEISLISFISRKWRMRFRSRGQTSRSQGNATPEILIAISKIRQMAGFCWIMLFNTDWAPQNGCHVLSRHDVKRMAVRLVRELY